MNDSTYFQWEKAVIAFSPDEEYTIVDLVCLSEQEKIVEVQLFSKRYTNDNKFFVVIVFKHSSKSKY